MIEHARIQDAGPYLCEAFNPAGTRMASGFLIVKSPPKFLDDPEPDQYDPLGGNSMLDCPVVADPQPTITWTKNSQVSIRNYKTEFVNERFSLRDRKVVISILSRSEQRRHFFANCFKGLVRGMLERSIIGTAIFSVDL